MGRIAGAVLTAVLGSRFAMAGVALTVGYSAGDMHGQRETARAYQAAAASAEAEDLRRQIAAGQAVAQAASARAQRSDAARAALQEKVDAFSTTLHAPGGSGGPCELDRSQRLRLCDLAGLPGCAAAPPRAAGRPARRDGAGDP